MGKLIPECPGGGGSGVFCVLHLHLSVAGEAQQSARECS